MKLKIKRIVTTETVLVIESNDYTDVNDDVFQTAELMHRLKQPIDIDDLIHDELMMENNSIEVTQLSHKVNITEAKQ